MKTLAISPRAAAGGAETLLLQTVKGLARPFDPWHVVFFEAGPVEAELRGCAGVTTEVLDAGRLRDIGRFLRTVRQLRHRLLAGGFKRAVAWMPKAHLYLAPAAWGIDIDVRWWQHGIPRPPSWIDRLATWLPASAILCPSRVAAEAQERLGGAPVRVVPPGLSGPHADSEAARKLRRELLSDGQVLALTVSRIQPSKGLHVLVECAQLLASQLPGLVWAIAGGARPEDESYHRSLVSAVLAAENPRDEAKALLSLLPEEHED